MSVFNGKTDKPRLMTAIGYARVSTGDQDTALQLDPGNIPATCLLATAYQGLGNAAKAQEYNTKCDQLNQQSPQ